MTRFFFLLLLIPLLSVSALSDPAPNPAYTLDECLAIGRSNSIPVANAGRDEQIAEAGILQTRSQVLPHLDLNSSYTRMDEVPTFTTGDQTLEMGKLDNYSASAELSQLLYNGGQINAALRAARAYRLFAAWGKTSAEARLHRDITTSFYDILFAEAAVKVHQESVAQLRSFAEQTQSRFALKLAAEFDVLTARVRLANALPLLINASNRVNLAKAAFRNLVHLPVLEFSLAGDLRETLESRPLQELQTLGLLHRPELQQARLQVQLREEDVRATQGTYSPEVRAFANYGGVNPPQFSTAADGWDWQWTAGLRATWALFDGLDRRGKILEKRMELEKSKATLQDYQNAVVLEIHQAFLDYDTARQTYSASRETVQLAEKALAIAKTRYDQGVSTYLDFTESNVALSQSKLTLLNALRDEQTAVARLYFAAGLTPVNPPEK